MTEPSHNFRIAERLRMPIAIITEQGSIKWNNPAFDATFGSNGTS